MTLDTVLANLEQAQLVRQIRSVDTMLPVEFGAIYQFKHSLTQEAAYRSLSRRLRQQTHRRVAECYEQLFADKLDEYAAVLAQHYAEAGDTAKAFVYSRRAGDAALRIYATAEAIAHYEQALALDDTAQRLTDEIIQSKHSTLTGWTSSIPSWPIISIRRMTSARCATISWLATRPFTSTPLPRR